MRFKFRTKHDDQSSESVIVANFLKEFAIQNRQFIEFMGNSNVEYVESSEEIGTILLKVEPYLFNLAMDSESIFQLASMFKLGKPKIGLRINDAGNIVLYSKLEGWSYEFKVFGINCSECY